MRERVLKLIAKDAEELNITPEKLFEYADKGSKLIFDDPLIERVYRFGGDSLTDDRIREIVLVLAEGGTLRERADKIAGLDL